MQNTLLSPISQDWADTGEDDPSTNHNGSLQMVASRKTNFAAPVNIESTTAGSNTPGQKNDAGNGVIVNIQAVDRATKLDIPDMYAKIRVMLQVWSDAIKIDSNSAEYD